MPKTIRNQFEKNLTYEKLEWAHKLSQKGKTTKKDVVLFNLKKEEYLQWLYEQLKNGTYEHGGYRIFYVKVPKRRRIQVSRYIDRIVHRWLVDNFLKEYFIKSFINTSYACIKNKGMHCAVLDVQKTMKHCDRIWGEYYILKMDVAKYFQNVDRKILVEILNKIRNFLNENLKLQLNSKTQIIKSKNGVNFCGYKINTNRLKIRDRGKRNLKLKLKKVKKYIKDEELSSKEAYRYITGHIGYIKIANVKNLTEKLFYCVGNNE